MDEKNASHNDGGEKREPRLYKEEGLLDRYMRWTDKNPVKSSCLTCASVGALGAMLGARKTSELRGTRVQSIDWMEVIAFALHGGLVAGPLETVLGKFIKENFRDSQTRAVVFEQIILQPPKLFLLFASIEVSRAALVAVPSALAKSSSLIGKTVAESLRIWPLTIYLLLRSLKRRKHYVAALKLCSVVWMGHLAKRRSRQRAN